MHFNRESSLNTNFASLNYLGPEALFDVGFLSVCCEYVLLALVIKEVALAYSRTDYRKVGNPRRDRRGKKVESGRCHAAAEGERCQNLTGRPQPPDNTQINRNGSIKDGRTS